MSKNFSETFPCNITKCLLLKLQENTCTDSVSGKPPPFAKRIPLRSTTHLGGTLSMQIQPSGNTFILPRLKKVEASWDSSSLWLQSTANVSTPLGHMLGGSWRIRGFAFFDSSHWTSPRQNIILFPIMQQWIAPSSWHPVDFISMIFQSTSGPGFKINDNEFTWIPRK